MTAGRLFRTLAWWSVMSLVLVAGPAAAGDPPAPVISSHPSAAPAAPDRARVRMNRRVFDQVWNEVRRDYYDPGLHGVDWTAARRTWRPAALAAPDDAALYRALGEMLDLLDDDHAAVLSPTVARRADRLRVRRAVIGVTLRRDADDDGLYVVERVRPGSPAQAAGVSAGWRLDADQGAWTPEMEVEDARPVILTFRGGDGVTRSLTITPRIMDPTPAFVADGSRPGVAVLRIEGFEAGLGRWMGEQLEGLPSETDVILDLRGNPGGRLMEAEAALSCFLPPDFAWATRIDRSGEGVALKTAGGCGDLSGPVANEVAVLVDAESRSAAELTPAALQEAGRAVVVGEPTAGAVLISRETRLSDGGRLILSRADFITTGGVRLEKHGVTPDLVVGDADGAADPVLDAAVAALATPTEQVLAAPDAPL